MKPRKIGQWVFGLKDCPEEATAAVVNKSGTFAWWCGTHPEDLRPDPDAGGWRARGLAKGYWEWPDDDYEPELFADDWDRSLLFRDVPKNQASDHAIILAN